MKKKTGSPIFFLSSALLLTLLLPCVASAQVFNGETKSDATNIISPSAAPTAQSGQIKRFAPQIKRSSLPADIGQKSPSGDIEIKQVISSDEQYANANNGIKDKEEIVLYMRDFRISKTFSGTTTCFMRFYVKSTFKQRISNLSYRLKWPKMETPLSFDNIEPQSTVYQEYGLLGDGCYTMDQIPNVIVNRCRVRDMTQQACASRIHWMQ